MSSPSGHSAAKKLQEDFVDLKDVFAVKVKRRRSVGQRSGGTLLGITLFICKRKKGAKLKDHTVHFNNLSADHCEVWFKHLKDILNAGVGERRSDNCKPQGGRGSNLFLHHSSNSSVKPTQPPSPSPALHTETRLTIISPSYETLWQSGFVQIRLSRTVQSGGEWNQTSPSKAPSQKAINP
ncbi:hypothetical protein NFI96_003438 [Prochilodus magdalenae]|nr:hypothetical protein NFI96_003438 [Prochilodus magdalenae]